MIAQSATSIYSPQRFSAAIFCAADFLARKSVPKGTFNYKYSGGTAQ